MNLGNLSLKAVKSGVSGAKNAIQNYSQQKKIKNAFKSGQNQVKTGEESGEDEDPQINSGLPTNQDDQTNSNSRYQIESDVTDQDGKVFNPLTAGSSDQIIDIQPGSNQQEQLSSDKVGQAVLDDEHYMDNDVEANGQTISNTKILPSMSEDENPFSTGPVQQSSSQQNNRSSSQPRKSKLSGLHQKSKSLMRQLNQFREDAMQNLNSNKDGVSINDEEFSPSDQNALKFNEYQNSFMSAQDPNTNTGEDSNKGLTKKNTGSMRNLFSMKKDKSNSLPRVQRGRAAEVTNKVDIDNDNIGQNPNFYTNDQLDMPSVFPTEFKSEIIKMICQGGRKCFVGDDESLIQLSDDDISPFDQHAVEKRNRLIDLANILDEPNIDLGNLRQSVFHGVPFLRDDMTIWIKDKDIKTLPITQQISHSFRAITWRMMLGTLGFDNQKWKEQIFQNIDTYELWKSEFIKDAKYMESLYDDKEEFKKDYQTARAEHRLIRLTKIRGDQVDKDKLAEIPKKKFESEWNNFFADNDLWDEIWKDVRRTRTEIGFFKLPLDTNRKLTTEDLDRLEMQFETPKMDLSAQDLDSYIRTHSDILARILFVYAKLNAGLKYVQGMNEVLAVLYYSFWLGGSLIPPSFKEESKEAEETSEKSTASKDDVFTIDFKHFEADVFSAFSSVMADLRDGFIRELDKEDSGLQGHIHHYDRVLRVVDQPVWIEIAEEAQVTHQFYTLRWFMLLMCQEFELLCVLRLWDTLVAAEGPALTSAELISAGQFPSNQDEFKIQRFEFIDYVSVALVLRKRQEIIEGEGDFANVMDALQGTSNTVKSLDDIEDLIASSVKVCLKWMRWLVDKTSGKRKKKGAGEKKNWTNYLVKNRNEDEDEYDEELENEYGEEVALQKYGAAKVYEKIILQKR